MDVFIGGGGWWMVDGGWWMVDSWGGGQGAGGRGGVDDRRGKRSDTEGY